MKRDLRRKLRYNTNQLENTQNNTKVLIKNVYLLIALDLKYLLYG